MKKEGTGGKNEDGDRKKVNITIRIRRARYLLIVIGSRLDSHLLFLLFRRRDGASTVTYVLKQP